MSLVNGKPYYYSFDLGRVPSLYDFMYNKPNGQNCEGVESDSDSDAGCKCYDACVKCKVVDVSVNSDHKHTYYLVNYDKKILQKRISDGVEYGYEQYVRSVILNADRRIVCFSPPMCEPRSAQQSKEHDSTSNEYVFDFSKVRFAEEFVEGTMVNLFYNPSNDVKGWEYATRNVVSPLEKKANESGVVDKKCFRRMFLEACDAAGLNFDDLPKEYSYSFVLQHPDNTIVAPVKSATLYIIAMYYIDGTTVYEMDRSVVKWSEFSRVYHPARFLTEDLQKVIRVWASNTSLYYYPGVMFRGNEGQRYKFRNPNYECAKNAKGVDEKSRFIYLHLKKLGELKKHYERFPEDEFAFFRHQTNLYNYTHNLHHNYVECYVHKKKPLKEYAVEYRKNMFQLHEFYNTKLKTDGKRVNMTFVIEFMNEQSLFSQMFVLRKFEDSVSVVDGEIGFGTLQENDENKKCPDAPRKSKY